MRKIIYIAMLIVAFPMNAMAFDLGGTIGAIVSEITRPSTVISIGSAAGCAKLEGRTAQRNCSKILRNMQKDMLRKEEDAYRQIRDNAPTTRSSSTYSYKVNSDGSRSWSENGSVTMTGAKGGWNNPYGRPNYQTWK